MTSPLDQPVAMLDHKELISPHGSTVLLPCMAATAHRAGLLAHAQTLPQLRISSREKGDLTMLAIGGFTPLTGFMGAAEWHSVCESMQLPGGTFWPIPITLSASEAFAARLAPGDEIALCDAEDEEPLAVLRLTETYRIDPDLECRAVFGTTDPAHPGVAMVRRQPPVNLAGQVQVLSDGGFKARFGDLFMTPEQTRAQFAARGWRRIAAFQTRNPMHRSHEYLTKVALEISDGVLIHSLLGNLKPGDIPASVRCEAIDRLVAGYYPPGAVLHAGYPLDMRYAGPREALLHALFRQNYGCTHLIVGRDHAGVGSYYGPFDAQRIFDELPVDALRIKPLKIDLTFWCYGCGGMASSRICPHGAGERLDLSGTRLRELLSRGEAVAPEFSRPEVLSVLREFYAERPDGGTTRASH